MPPPDESVAAPYDLLAAEHDLSDGESQIARSYVVCSTPRSGSTLLAEAMHRTGKLGVPAEYIDVGASLPFLYHRWACTDLDDYVNRLHRLRVSGNGVFGLKAHWHQVQGFANVSQGAEPYADIDFALLHAVLQRVAPQPAYIYVTRRDKARQAVSHWVAANTQAWIKLGDESLPAVPDYDFEGIRPFTEGIDASEESWERFFALARVQPLRVVYEDFVESYEDTVRRAATHVGIDPAGLVIPPPRMKRQSSQQSKKYAERYRAELAQ